MKNWIEQAGPDRFKIDPKLERVGDNKLIGSMRRLGVDDISDARHYVLTIRDDKIADMQVGGSRRQAYRFARRSS